MKNAWSKSRKIENAYLTITQGDWEWKVLKAYQSRANERKNPCARWFMAVKSPMTYGTYEMGDTYLKEIPFNPSCQELQDRLAQENL